GWNLAPSSPRRDQRQVPPPALLRTPEALAAAHSGRRGLRAPFVRSPRNSASPGRVRDLPQTAARGNRHLACYPAGCRQRRADLLRPARPHVSAIRADLGPVNADICVFLCGTGLRAPNCAAECSELADGVFPLLGMASDCRTVYVPFA